MVLHPELSNVSPNERIEDWVSQAADVLAATSLSSVASPIQAHGKTVTIDIPLDEHLLQDDTAAAAPPRPRPEAVHTVYKRREPIRRDSLKRREALLKGKEGSRRRQRWENDRLLNNPYAEPPLLTDWEVRPTYPVRRVPYMVAPLYEAEYARYEKERQKKAEAARIPASKEDAEAAKVARELKAKLKKCKGAKGLLQELEEEVRGFVRQWEEKQRQMERAGLIEPDSSDDEEIVFVGRDGAMSDQQRHDKEQIALEKDKLIFRSLLDDHGAAFGRYLVHSIGTYYGLKTWSVTTGACREAYVGLNVDPRTRRPSLTRSELPRPLYAVV